MSERRYGVLGVQPLGERGVPKLYPIEGRGKAFPPMIFCLIALACAIISLADVTCSWDGTTWTCSGEGSEIVVGAGGSGPGIPPPETVITNYIGVCTNCSNIAPQDLRDLVDAAKSSTAAIQTSAGEIKTKAGRIKESIQSNLDEIATYETFGFSTAEGNYATNYMHTANNAQSAGMMYAYNQFVTYQPTAAVNTKNRAAINSGNGIYYYANNAVVPQLQANANFCDSATIAADSIVTETQTLNSILDTIRSGAVECMGDGYPGNPTNNPSGVVSGNWCTKDQGNAITNLLNELKAYLKKVDDRLVAQTNYQRECRDLIRSGLFTEYNAIPSASALGDTWQQVYLDGAETNWGYQPTNILARIELLLYGMSGVGTNGTFSSGEMESTEVTETMEDTSQSFSEQVEAISTDADGQAVQSLGNAFSQFFEVLENLGQTDLSEGTELFPSYALRVGNTEVEIPDLTVEGGGSLTAFNSIKTVASSALGALYMIGAGILVFFYWRWFAEWAVKLSKWAIELITAVFSS